MKWVWTFWIAGSVYAAVPPTLSDTGFFSSEKRSFEPQYPLWSDGAEKARWVLLPPDTRINTGKPSGAPTSPHKGNMDYWIFPVGTKFWKEFSREGKRVETRYLVKVNETDWEFAAYEWNAEETEAVLVTDEGKKLANHEIPSRKDCLSCHNRGGDAVLGFDYLQLSNERDPMAPHARPLENGDVTLRELIETNRLTYGPPALLESPPQIYSNAASSRAAIGYLHANCGNCHNPTGTAGHAFLNFRYPFGTKDEISAPAFKTAVGQLSAKVKIPGLETTFRIEAGFPEKSAVVYSMRRLGELPMPGIGVKHVDEEALQLIETWIREMSGRSP